MSDSNIRWTVLCEEPAHIEELAAREPQVEAYQELVPDFKSGKRRRSFNPGVAEVRMAAIAPFGIAKGRVLVVAPNLTIKEGLFES